MTNDCSEPRRVREARPNTVLRARNIGMVLAEFQVNNYDASQGQTAAFDWIGSGLVII